MEIFIITNLELPGWGCSCPRNRVVILKLKREREYLDYESGPSHERKGDKTTPGKESFPGHPQSSWKAHGISSSLPGWGPELQRSLCVLSLYLKLGQLKCFWMQVAKNWTQTELKSKWEFGAQRAKYLSRDCVWVEARFKVQEPVRNGSLSLPSLIHQLCPQVGFALRLASPGGCQPQLLFLIYIRGKRRGRLPQPLNKGKFTCWLPRPELPELIKVSRVQDYSD